jgi:amino-acid N-acetyltransferase
VIATAALYPFPEEGMGELACLAVDPAYRGQGRGDALLREAEERARAEGLGRLLVLTTRAEHWFRERGFVEAGREALPEARQALYNLERRSKVLLKALA